jgi:hypothetical protein
VANLLTVTAPLLHRSQIIDARHGDIQSPSAYWVYESKKQTHFVGCLRRYFWGLSDKLRAQLQRLLCQTL